MILKKTFQSWQIMQFFKRPYKILEIIDILNLLQLKEEETIWCQNQIVTLNIY